MNAVTLHVVPSNATPPFSEKQIFVGMMMICVIFAIPVITYVVLFPYHDPFRFEVDSLEAKTTSSSQSLDVNLTFSMITHYPVLFESFMVLLAYDNADTVISSTTKLDDPLYLNRVKTVDVGMTIDKFTRKEDNLYLRVLVSGLYMSLREGDQVYRQSFNIACKGIKVVLLSSHDNVTLSVGRMLDGPVRCK